MPRKLRKTRGSPYGVLGVSRNAINFPRNNKFIQRSKKMETFHKQQLCAAAEFVEDYRLLPKSDYIYDDEFNDLLTEYDSLKRDPTTNSTINNSIGTNNNSNNTNESQQLTHEKGVYDKSDSFMKHFQYDISSEHINCLVGKKSKVIKYNWLALGCLNIELPMYNLERIVKVQTKQPSILTKSSDFENLGIKSVLRSNVAYPMSGLQSEMLHILTNYQDFYYPQRLHDNGEHLRYTYCLHILNHIFKSKTLMLRNSDKVSALAKSSNLSITQISIPDCYRDQGLSRLKVLIILPFRESALRTVNILARLLIGDQSQKSNIINYERFVNDFTGNTISFPKTNPKPVDYEETFHGNTDDNFKLGIRCGRKSLTLFSDINSSDILITTPLALRMHINNEEKDFDFLNSIEILVIDQAEVYLAQNWENLIYTLDHLHLQPTKLPDTNCQRVRGWCLNGAARFYRQTILFSSHELPEFRSIFSSKCHNYEGKVRISNSVTHGYIRKVVIPISQIFQYVASSSIESAIESRFQYFMEALFPLFTNPSFSHCMLYVPSYFDYVRLRNSLKSKMTSFVQINEYTKVEKISRARDLFFHGGVPLLLYSERAHFFRRTRIKGIRHLIMYQPPNWPNFYSELINLMLDSNQNPRDGLSKTMSITMLYSKYDILTLSNIIGSENANRLNADPKNICFSIKNSGS